MKVFDAKCPDATNDNLAWAVTNIKIEKNDNFLLPTSRFYFICDEALPATEFVLTPFGGRGIGIWRDSFNIHLSVMRRCI
jgi:hypothetical protein